MPSLLLGCLLLMNCKNSLVWISNVFCRYFLLIFGLPFHFCNSMFWRAKVFNFDDVQFINFSYSLFFCHIFLLNLRSKIFPCFSSFIDFALHLHLWLIFSELLSIVWGSFSHMDTHLLQYCCICSPQPDLIHQESAKTEPHL